jgi:hypothetical protein
MSVDFQHRTHRSRDSLRILVGSSINKCLVTSNLTYDITPQNAKPSLPKSKAIPPTFTFYMLLHNVLPFKIRVMFQILHTYVDSIPQISCLAILTQHNLSINPLAHAILK